MKKITQFFSNISMNMSSVFFGMLILVLVEFAFGIFNNMNAFELIVGIPFVIVVSLFVIGSISLLVVVVTDDKE